MRTDLDAQAMQQALEPCPFCGSEKVKHFSYTHPEPDHIYQCHDCASIGGGGKTEAEARQKWNRRATHPAPDAVRRETVEACAKVAENSKLEPRIGTPDMLWSAYNTACNSCAAAIRAMLKGAP